MSDFMSINNLNLRHRSDNLHSIIRLLSQWIVKDVQLLKERKLLLQEVQELVKSSKLIVCKQKYAQKFEFRDACDVLKLIILTV